MGAIWELRAKGLSDREIGRRLGLPRGGVSNHLARTGGIRPRARRRPERCLGLEEREEISRAIARGHSLARRSGARLGPACAGPERTETGVLPRPDRDGGVRLADELGLAEFSMNKLAASLNSPTMSLYRYIPSKNDLLTLMLDAAFGPIPAMAPSPTPWRAGLKFWAKSLFAVYLTHPWMLDVRISGLPMTPNPLQWIDYGLQSLNDTGLGEDDQLGALLLLDGHVRGSARLANDLHDAGGDATSAPPFSETMSQLVHEERYPALARLIASGAIDSPSDADPARFEFGLARVLDGIEDLTPMGQRGSDARSSR
jgi:AcrR family transcriptional regulator